MVLAKWNARGSCAGRVVVEGPSLEARLLSSASVASMSKAKVSQGKCRFCISRWDYGLVTNPNTKNQKAPVPLSQWAPHWAPRSLEDLTLGSMHMWVQGLEVWVIYIHLESKSSISTHEGWCCGGFRKNYRLRKGATKNWQKQSRLLSARV